MTAGRSDKKQSSVNDPGAGAANTVPPSVSATTSEENDDRKEAGGCAVADEEAAEFEIFTQYRGMLKAIRGLPRKMRSLARREARDWLRASLKASRERRAIERQARRLERPKQIGRNNGLRPRQLGP
jgi:hypothetical protein